MIFLFLLVCQFHPRNEVNYKWIIATYLCISAFNIVHCTSRELWYHRCSMSTKWVVFQVYVSFKCFISRCSFILMVDFCVYYAFVRSSNELTANIFGLSWIYRTINKHKHKPVRNFMHWDSIYKRESETRYTCNKHHLCGWRNYIKSRVNHW